MIFKTLSDKSSKIIHYSNIRYTNIPLDKNICFDLLIISNIIKSKRDLLDNLIVLTVPSTIVNNDSLNKLTSDLFWYTMKSHLRLRNTIKIQ